ncbi:ABC transporter ATP-binding protein [Tenggerimyces flavus]|uniref:ABC transporter ATP-binding protein n=1 Tax=Tenggerimyces flavus TaxID=1708749 RepID=A0ABV7Y7L6_9ACTN|nr:ABC transporter ATP-binding protein [Tenggerimyces flavus]MBM7785728.1 iron complex transport system ATP-binding protein [Tenggerimyces flavus]
MRIDVEQLAWMAGSTTIVSGIDLAVRSGETVGLVGPNGSGKSSLLRCVAGLRTPTRGTVRFDSEDIRGWSPRRVAQHLAFVEQASDADSDLRLGDVVALGRTPFRDRWRGLSRADRIVVEAAVERVELAGLEGRAWKTLSGGERQRAHLARALAQQPWAVLLDEPTNHLDVKHQLALLELLAETDQTVIVALHDLSMAARYCDRLAMLHSGTLVASGTPEEVLTPGRLRDVFGIDAEVGTDSLGNLAIAYRSPA